ncbi:MAG TPA: hypothetical protein VFF53_03495 [Geobacteraceae bacterium]|nr:hypothetical protein [Aquabacterium sp.]HZV81214.1 hypothetical protein [Geobacteraceae bacterium]
MGIILLALSFPMIVVGFIGAAKAAEGYLRSPYRTKVELLWWSTLAGLSLTLTAIGLIIIFTGPLGGS